MFRKFIVILLLIHAIDANCLTDVGGAIITGVKNFLDFGNSPETLIYPGTKWCGPGNISQHFDDLGVLEKEDKCCRTHDHCDHIGKGDSKYGLVNNEKLTR